MERSGFCLIVRGEDFIDDGKIWIVEDIVLYLDGKNL